MNPDDKQGYLPQHSPSSDTKFQIYTYISNKNGIVIVLKTELARTPVIL